MADTVVSDAARFPQDEGYPNIADGNETWDSAGHLGLLATATANGPFIYDGLTFSTHDATNDTVDIDPGVAVLDMSEDGTVSTQSALGGSSAPTYDTTLSKPGAVVVELPTATTLSMTDTALNPVWIAYATDGTYTTPSPGDVYLRHGSAESEPSAHPNIKLGETNPDDSTQDFRAGYDNPPNGDGWRLDPNSPHSSTGAGAASVTFNLAGRYDQVKVVGDLWTGSSNNHQHAIRAHGVSTLDYEAYLNGSNGRTGLDSWNDITDMRPGSNTTAERQASIEFMLDGRWDSTNTFCFIEVQSAGIYNTGGGTDSFWHGVLNAPGAPPLTDFQIVEQNGVTGWGYDVRVYGRHVNSYPF